MNSRMIKRGFKRVGIYLAAVVVLLWTLLPILWMFISSITPTADLLTIDGKWLSDNMNFNRYIEIVLTVIFAILFGGVSAYAFARLRFKFKNTLLMATMFFQLLPSITLVIPLYVIGRKLGMIDQPMFLVVL